MSSTRPSLFSALAVVAGAVVAGCGGGGVAVTVGADGVVEGVTAVDGSAAFDRFFVSVADVAVGDNAVVGPVVVDASAATLADPVVVSTFSGLAAGRQAVSTTVVPAAGAASANAADDVVALMADNGFSLFVSGTLTAGEATKRFAWGFSTNTRYVDCDVDVVVADGATTEWQLTLRPEELLRTSLVDEAAPVAVAAVVAADENDDGAVDVDEAAGVAVDDLDNDGAYDGGGADVVTLFDFVRERSRQVLFMNADGRCIAERR